MPIQHIYSIEYTYHLIIFFRKAILQYFYDTEAKTKQKKKNPSI